LTGQHKVVNFLTGALPNLFTEADAQALAPKLEPAAAREYLTVMRRKLAGMEGMVLKDVVASDPIGMSAIRGEKGAPIADRIWRSATYRRPHHQRRRASYFIDGRAEIARRPIPATASRSWWMKCCGWRARWKQHFRASTSPSPAAIG
jgi:hypothetical protein